MIERLNRAVMRYIDRKNDTPRIARMELQAGGFAVTCQAHDTRPAETSHHEWHDICRVVATLTPGLVGDDEAVLVELSGSVLQLTPGVPGFEAFLEAGAGQVAGWRPVADWRVELAATPPGQVVEVLKQRG